MLVSKICDFKQKSLFADSYKLSENISIKFPPLLPIAIDTGLSEERSIDQYVNLCNLEVNLKASFNHSLKYALLIRFNILSMLLRNLTLERRPQLLNLGLFGYVSLRLGL